MIRITFLASFIAVSFIPSSALASSVPGFIEDYQYQVTDIATKGLTSEKLFAAIDTSWMELEHSVCANRALLWGYQLHNQYKIQTGKIFMFFVSDLWTNDKQGWMYHAGTYVIENGKEVFLERSYPTQVKRPLNLIEWMDDEMEGRADAKDCIEITKKDVDLTPYFYARRNLPRKRGDGLAGAPCYYRKVPEYFSYPATVAEVDFGKDANGKPIDYTLSEYDRTELYYACVDAASGGKWARRGSARSFCEGRY